MPFPGRKPHRGLVVTLMIVSGFGGLFALALLLGAITGKGFTSGILLAGAGLFLLIAVILFFVFGVMYLKSSKSS